jgi:long-chain acyl-CoA synthetase
MQQLTQHTTPSHSSPSFLDGRTLPEVFLKRAEVFANQRAFLVKKEGAFRPMTWGEIHEQSLGLFDSLRKNGIQKGDRVAILSNSRAEWSIADWSIQSLGAVTVPVYQSSTPEDTAFILEHSETKLIFAEDASQGEKLRSIFEKWGRTLPVVFFGTKNIPTEFPHFSFEAFCQTNDREKAGLAQRACVEAIQPEDLASIVYTSGTTGKPKGARLLHSCFAAEIRSITQEFSLNSDDVSLAFLPFAHVLGRIESLLPLMAGTTTAFAESVAAVSANLQEVKPTILISVPRIFEKIYTKILSDIQSGPEYRKKLFEWSVQIGREVAQLRSEKKPISVVLQLKYGVANQLVFSKIREKMGGRLRFTISGGAPLSVELCQFYHACGIKILEGYGLSETTAAIAVNRPGDFRFSSVGRPLAWTHFRIAEDGEIQVKGPAVFAGYHQDDQATEEAVTKDGWFCTGDIGEIDDRGFLRITDRKKELIVTSGGKNIAPQKLENRIKQIPLVSNALVYGDKQKYLICLLTIDPAAAKRWAREKHLPEQMEALAEDPTLVSELEKEMKKINTELASYETIKRFKVLPRDFSLEGGEVTPSLKLKRKVITEKYRSQIDALY